MVMKAWSWLLSSEIGSVGIDRGGWAGALEDGETWAGALEDEETWAGALKTREALTSALKTRET